MGIVASIRSEFLRYRDLGDKAIAQLDDAALTAAAISRPSLDRCDAWHPAHPTPRNHFVRAPLSK